MSRPPIWAVDPPGTRKPRFTREQIAAAALALADSEGFEALSMRRIADALGAGTMTLYHYVRTKDDLLTLIDDALMAEVVARSVPLPDGWRAGVGKLARATRDTFVRHPWALHSLQGARIGPIGLRHVEQSLAAVESLRGDLATKLEVLSIVDDYVFGHVLRVNEATRTGPPDVRTARMINTFTSDQLRGGDFPRLQALIGDDEPMTAFTRVADHMMVDHRFELGLEALLDGLTARLALRDGTRGAERTRRGGRARSRRGFPR
jgi:AcrR family transcriptional regulator